jgi:DNA polymerase III subunit delta'
LVAEAGAPSPLSAERLPWLDQQLTEILEQHRGHALLLQGSLGNGCWDLAWALGQAWLCESSAKRPCGHCDSCHLFNNSSHPDQQWLLPQDLALQRGLPVDIKEGRKPSRQIRVDDVRVALEGMTSTSGRGRGQVLVVFPGEAMNDIAASALLKTLEEPPAGTQIVIATAEPARLLPTIRSRCQHWNLQGPDRDTSRRWLEKQGVHQPDVLLAAASGRPLDALALHSSGLTAQAWADVPQRLAQGDAQVLAGLGVPGLLEVLAKVCHDAMAATVGGAEHFFPNGSLGAKADLVRLSAWQRSLGKLQRHADHPWNEPLMVEALVLEAQQALQPAV